MMYNISLTIAIVIGGLALIATLWAIGRNPEKAGKVVGVLWRFPPTWAKVTLVVILFVSFAPWAEWLPSPDPFNPNDIRNVRATLCWEEGGDTAPWNGTGECVNAWIDEISRTRFDFRYSDTDRQGRKFVTTHVWNKVADPDLGIWTQTYRNGELRMETPGTFHMERGTDLYYHGPAYDKKGEYELKLTIHLE